MCCHQGIEFITNASKPHIGSATEWAARNAEQGKGDGEIIMFPEPQVMTDHPLPEDEDVEEVSNEAETLNYMQEESNVSRASSQTHIRIDQQQLSPERIRNHTTHMVRIF